MKTNIFFFLFSLIFISGFSQENNFKYSLDSITSENNTFRKFSYDERGNILSYIDYYDTILYTYDLNNNLTSEEIYDYFGLGFKSRKTYEYKNNLLVEYIYSDFNSAYDNEGNKWSPVEKTRYTYNQDNLINSKVVSKFRNNQWEIFSSNTYSYDTNNNLILDLSANSKIEYLYDDNNNKTASISYYINNSNWVFNRKTIWNYDANNNLLDETHYIYENNEWVYNINSRKDEYSYDSQNNLLSKIELVWRNNQWENFTKESHSYDINNNCLSDSIFKFTDGEWDGEVGYIYTYDENRNLLSETMIQCYMKEWFNNIKTEYEFDYNYTSEDTYVPDYITSFNMTTGYKDYIFNCNDQWDLSSSCVYHYTQRNVSIEEITNSNNIRVYPNPSTNYIVLSIEENSPFEFEIYNSNGNLIEKGITQNSIRVDISKFSPGLYFFTIKAKNKVFKSKFIKI